MNEKQYKRITEIGAANLAIGVLVMVVGIVAGILSVVNGARLLASRKDMTI